VEPHARGQPDRCHAWHEHCAPAIRDSGGGAIINISSTAGLTVISAPLPVSLAIHAALRLRGDCASVDRLCRQF
jgi:hypothetical protein